MRNWRRTATVLLLGTIFLPVVMKNHEPGCGTALESYGQEAPTIRAVATAFAEGQEWAIETDRKSVV